MPRVSNTLLLLETESYIWTRVDRWPVKYH